jgi:hypothetical protein
MCTICQQWGHHSVRCRTNRLVCAKCSGPHSIRAHSMACQLCKEGKGNECKPNCANCGGSHPTTSVACPFWEQWFNYNGIQDLVRRRRDELLALHPGKPLNKATDKGKGKAKAPIVAKGTTMTGKTVTLGYKRPTPANSFRGPIPPPPPHFQQTKITMAAQALQMGQIQMGCIEDADAMIEQDRLEIEHEIVAFAGVTILSGSTSAPTA